MNIQIHHIAVVVTNLDEAIPFWRDALGLPLTRTEHNIDEAVDIAFLPFGASETAGELELLAPFNEDSGVARYLEKRGAGLHHLCVQVDDIDAALARITAHGGELINETAREKPDGTRYAFVHPKSTGGVLLELYEIAKGKP